jgi:hypothetical protein
MIPPRCYPIPVSGTMRCRTGPAKSGLTHLAIGIEPRLIEPPFGFFENVPSELACVRLGCNLGLSCAVAANRPGPEICRSPSRLFRGNHDESFMLPVARDRCVLRNVLIFSWNRLPSRHTPGAAPGRFVDEVGKSTEVGSPVAPRSAAWVESSDRPSRIAGAPGHDAAGGAPNV